MKINFWFEWTYPSTISFSPKVNAFFCVVCDSDPTESFNLNEDSSPVDAVDDDVNFKIPFGFLFLFKII